MRAELLGQPQVFPQAAAVFPVQLGGTGRLDKEGGEAAVERSRHAGRGADDLGVGRGARQADEDVFLGVIVGAQRLAALRDAVHPVGGAAQRDLPQGHEVLPREEMPERPVRLVGRVDLPLRQPLDQVVRLDVHELDLVGGVKDAVGHPLPARSPR